MMDFIFFIKTFLLTIALILVLQIEVGEKSLETHAVGIAKSSMIVAPLNSVARGGAKAVRDLTGYVSGKINRNADGVDKVNNEEKKKESSSSFRWFGRSN